jgi:hypothetical protein
MASSEKEPKHDDLDVFDLDALDGEELIAHLQLLQETKREGAYVGPANTSLDSPVRPPPPKSLQLSKLQDYCADFKKKLERELSMWCVGSYYRVWETVCYELDQEKRLQGHFGRKMIRYIKSRASVQENAASCVMNHMFLNMVTIEEFMAATDEIDIPLLEEVGIPQRAAAPAHSIGVSPGEQPLKRLLNRLEGPATGLMIRRELTKGLAHRNRWIRLLYATLGDARWGTTLDWVDAFVGNNSISSSGAARDVVTLMENHKDTVVLHLLRTLRYAGLITLYNLISAAANQARPNVPEPPVAIISRAPEVNPPNRHENSLVFVDLSSTLPAAPTLRQLISPKPKFPISRHPPGHDLARKKAAAEPPLPQQVSPRTPSPDTKLPPRPPFLTPLPPPPPPLPHPLEHELARKKAGAEPPRMRGYAPPPAPFQCDSTLCNITASLGSPTGAQKACRDCNTRSSASIQYRAL